MSWAAGMGRYRDIAGVHGTYRKVAETMPAVELIGARLQQLRVSQARWLFDRPVSNSGRIQALILGSRKGLRLELDRGAGG